MSTQSIRAIGVPNMPEIRVGDDIPKQIITALELSSIKLEDGDIIIIASKIISKAEGRIIHRETVEISIQAKEIAGSNGFDPYKLNWLLGRARM